MIPPSNPNSVIATVVDGVLPDQYSPLLEPVMSRQEYSMAVQYINNNLLIYSNEVTGQQKRSPLVLFIATLTGAVICFIIAYITRIWWVFAFVPGFFIVASRCTMNAQHARYVKYAEAKVRAMEWLNTMMFADRRVLWRLNEGYIVNEERSSRFPTKFIYFEIEIGNQVQPTIQYGNQAVTSFQQQPYHSPYPQDQFTPLVYPQQNMEKSRLMQMEVE